MRQRLISFRLIVGVVILALLLAGCGGNTVQTQETAANTPPSDSTKAVEESTSAVAEGQGDTQIINTINGDVEIPAHPQRIVTQGYLANFLVFGVKPVGAPYWELESPHLKPDMVSGIDDIGQITGESVEKILALQPDLIVTVGGDQKLNEQYSKIAPTVVFPYGTFDNVHTEMTAFGKILGKEKEAEEWLTQFDGKVGKAREAIKDIVKPDQTYSILGAFGKEYYVYGDGVNRGGQAIYQQLGLTPPASVKKDMIDKDRDAMDISLEKMPEYAGDYIFFDVSGDAKFDPDNPVWKSLDAVKNNRVFFLDPDFFWPYDPIAVEAQVDKVVEMLQKGPDNR
ncbi:ABC transporter substrate-binding protein [Paenibacillus agri]|uniref:ABC transporter substrate-binding protein n=1 Tax=Paenibacillus agri TaxID=2744309 RepID=A0A850EQ09_9BACL|nr:ABC transporter substrate-binding protein [Paenibacillus agri]NUU63343.1 ABC transporter substrate-binding protein [Paenibacillus agri]